MPPKLYWNTVTPWLKTALTILMETHAFDSFRLVGGTSLGLQLGHRMSVDIDLFTDAAYNSVDFDSIDSVLRKSFAYVSKPNAGVIGMGNSYLIGENEHETIKLDIYYTDTFIQPALLKGPYRLATVEEIIAMKIDIVQRGGRKKDFWDLHELMYRYPLDKMMQLHAQRYSYSHDEKLIRSNFTNFKMADDDFDPICLRGKYWELIKYDFLRAVQAN